MYILLIQHLLSDVVKFEQLLNLVFISLWKARQYVVKQMPLTFSRV